MIFIDVAFFAAIAPLLPEYVDHLGLSKAEAGILSAAYAAGTLLGSLPAGFVASRMGPRKTVIHGLLLLGVASVVFGFGDQILLLDAARFIQGIAGALIWSGALTWLITTAPEEKRGSIIGSALGTAVAGALLGPALGAIAGSIGTEPVFSSVLVVQEAAQLGLDVEQPYAHRCRHLSPNDSAPSRFFKSSSANRVFAGRFRQASRYERTRRELRLREEAARRGQAVEALGP